MAAMLKKAAKTALTAKVVGFNKAATTAATATTSQTRAKTRLETTATQVNKSENSIKVFRS